MATSPAIDISIIITHWNRPARLKGLVDYLCGNFLEDRSARNKPTIEVIVVDSKSTKSESVRFFLSKIQTTLAQPDSLHAVFLDENKGPSYARAEGLRESRGSYIQFIDDDDWISLSKLDHQFSWAIEHPDADVIASPWARVTEDSAIGDFHSGEVVGVNFVEPMALIVVEVFTHLSACLLKKDTLLAVDAFQEEYWLVEDVHLQLKLVAHGAVFQTTDSTKPCFFYRQSDQTASLSSSLDRLPFQNACLRNLRIAERILIQNTQLSTEVAVRLSHLYGQLARGYFSSDRSVFEIVLGDIKRLNTHYRPQRPLGLAIVSWLLGYRSAEVLSHWLRRIKSRLSNSSLIQC